MDESSDASDSGHLLIIGGITESFDVVAELASLKCLYGITAGEDLFLSVCEVMKELELAWTRT